MDLIEWMFLEGQIDSDSANLAYQWLMSIKRQSKSSTKEELH
ncbi:protein of unknown function [uncultured Woeseiaceae bacterium]|uniref:Uncharacterized protein n=1 Tax=uncultured Woeseiaceae bacterium TaxID=1983305 RepID=A0A7D9H5N4_9GAMM|nr:protein of unknown function [uncultured Woeseiaceae bacterium]